MLGSGRGGDNSSATRGLKRPVPGGCAPRLVKSRYPWAHEAYSASRCSSSTCRRGRCRIRRCSGLVRANLPPPRYGRSADLHCVWRTRWVLCWVDHYAGRGAALATARRSRELTSAHTLDASLRTRETRESSYPSATTRTWTQQLSRNQHARRNTTGTTRAVDPLMLKTPPAP